MLFPSVTFFAPNSISIRLRLRPCWGSLQLSPRTPSWNLGILLLKGKNRKNGKGKKREAEKRQRGEKKKVEKSKFSPQLKFLATPLTGIRTWKVDKMLGIKATLNKNVNQVFCEAVSGKDRAKIKYKLINAHYPILDSNYFDSTRRQMVCRFVRDASYDYEIFTVSCQNDFATRI